MCSQKIIFSRMVITGWRRSLTRDDLWHLDKSINSEKLVSTWEHYWCKAKAQKLTKSAVNQGHVTYTQVPDEHVGNVPTIEIRTKKNGSVLKTLYSCFKRDILISGLINFCQVALQFVAPIILK